MWLHLPSAASRSAPESADLISPSSWLFQELARSATWNEKSRTSRSWFKGLKTAPWTMRLFGRISQPSTVSRGVAEWTSSMVVYPVSPIATQGNDKGKQTSETYGPPPQESYERYIQGDFFSKTSLESPATTGTEFGLSYETWATRLRRWSSAQRAWAQATFGSGSLPWPTPDAYNDPIAGGSAPWQESYEPGKQIHLHHSARMHWPTPNAGHQNDADTNWQERREKLKEKWNNGNGFGLTLSMATSTWPTATSRDWKDGTSAETAPENGLLGRAAPLWNTPGTDSFRGRGGDRKDEAGLDRQAKMWATPRHNDAKNSTWMHDRENLTLSGQVSSLQAPATETPGHECSPKCRRLNPQFVGWLQGMPMGWTSLAPLNSEDLVIWWHLCRERLRWLLSWDG